MGRRIVAGLNAEGRSAVVIADDGPAPDLRTGLLWRTVAMPAIYVPGEDPAAVPYSFDMMHSGGTSFAVARFPPGFVAPIHATDTLDYLVVLSGELVLVLEEGEARAGPGDFIVDCGVKHGWRNDGAEEAVFVVVVTHAHPTGDGRTG